jgi:hypothetical protein
MRDLDNIKSGAISIYEQFKPMAVMGDNPKELLLEDKNYSSPGDDYFGYLARRRLLESDDQREKIVLEKINAERYIPRESIENDLREKDNKAIATES